MFIICLRSGPEKPLRVVGPELLWAEERTKTGERKTKEVSPEPTTVSSRSCPSPDRPTLVGGHYVAVTGDHSPKSNEYGTLKEHH